MIGVCAFDPGTTTGVARGVFEILPSVWDGLASGSVESWEVEGSPGEQAWEIMGEYLDWMRSIHPVRAILTAEGFGVRLGAGAASKSNLLDPVRVLGGCEALSWSRGGIHWVTIAHQQPSAKSFATNARLRDHGLWVVGSEHRRDAVRHLAKAYSGYIKQNRPSR